MNPWPWIQANWPSFLKGLVLLGIGVGGAVLLMRWSEPAADLSVVSEWNQAIGKLGIEPVFPPEEDIYVGDVFAVITVDRRRPSHEDAAKSRFAREYKPLLVRAIKVHSEPMIDLLTQLYDDAPLFPPTKKRPASESDIWEIDAKQEGIFTKASKRGYLALAAFPGFTIRLDRAAAGGIAAWGAFLSGSRRDTDSMELRIPFAETYGVPSIVASSILDRLCETKLGNVCSDEGLRRHLTYVAGPIDDIAEDPESKTLRYLVDVELIFVNRVYIARSIEQRRGSGSWRSIGGNYGAGSPSENMNKQPSDPGKPNAIANIEIKPPSDKNPAAVVQQDYREDASLELKQTFQRPVVFGYRAVKKSFSYQLDKLNSAPKPGSEAP